MTGAEPAYCGGEVWFADETRIYLNGRSGRYAADKDEDLLTGAVSFFLDLGYAVAIPPYSEDEGLRPKVFKNESMVQWQSKESDRECA